MEPILAYANITECADLVAPAAPPSTYIGVAENLLPGVRVLADALNTRGMPLALLSAHVLECLLKAFLSRALDSDAPLTKNAKLRHNLLALWSLAKQKGLALPDQTPSWVECLSSLHDYPYYLRYSKGVHVIVSPAAEPMASDLQHLVGVVRSAVQ
jgi:hypothetical protein